jgi:uncharacterized protein (DUF433 family)
MSMTLVFHQSAAIVRTERGLTITGTRITLYDVMDYLAEQYPPKFIASLFDLTETQIGAAIDYIAAHRVEVETEYQQVLTEAEALRQHYEAQNRDRFAQIAAQPPKPGTEAAWEKLRADRAKRAANI